MTDTAASPATQPAGANAPAGVEGVVIELVKVLQKLERPDLAQRATAAAARLERPNTVVCVVGEFKQGKSSLVNGLLGRTICPVDDDLATSAITLVRYGDEPAPRSAAAARTVRRSASAPCRSTEPRRLGQRGGQPAQPEAGRAASRSRCRARC